jgi:phospholipase C
MFVFKRLLLSLTLAAAAVAASAGSSGAMPQAFRGDPALRPMVTGIPRLPLRLPAKKSHGKIKHVVIIMQENRSFDDLFQGYPGANTQSYGYDSRNDKVTLAPIPLEAPYDLNHDFDSFITDCNGTGSIPGTNCKNNGFNNEYTGCGRSCVDPQYGYVPASETTTYFDMAGQYVLADNMYTSQADDSFISHQYIISAQANSSVEFPRGSWGCGGGPSNTITILNSNRTFGNQQPMCWDVTTLGDELDTAGLPWRFYATNVNGYDGSGLWSAYQNIHHIYYGKDWANVVNPQSKIITDVANGSLAAVTWVTPTFANSDHSGFGSNTGPQWVASVVNAIGKSKYWKSTAIFVFWDEWGGWYDHVPPVYEDYDGLGFRVPLLIISPYAKQNYVSHVQYEHGSMLRFAEDEFGLPQMSASDTRANSPAADAFDFTQKPRPFKSFSAPRVQVHNGSPYLPRGVDPD